MTELVVAMGLKQALIGRGVRPGREDIAVYDVEACIKIIAEREGIDWQEASEYFHEEVLTVDFGDYTPVWVYPWASECNA